MLMATDSTIQSWLHREGQDHARGSLQTIGRCGLWPWRRTQKKKTLCKWQGYFPSVSVLQCLQSIASEPLQPPSILKIVGHDTWIPWSSILMRWLRVESFVIGWNQRRQEGHSERKTLPRKGETINKSFWINIFLCHKELLLVLLPDFFIALATNPMVPGLSMECAESLAGFEKRYQPGPDNFCGKRKMETIPGWNSFARFFFHVSSVF